MKNTNTPGFLVYGSIWVSAVVLLSLYLYLQNQKEKIPTISVTEIQENTQKPTQTEVTTTEEETITPVTKKPLPTQINLAAPFYSQAPLGDWSYPWQEACEEASILLAANVYWKHNWTREEFNTEILKMVEWQKEKFGTYLDTTVAQTAQIVNDYLKLKTITHENPTYEDVVEILNKWHFIIMFFAGKELGNPNFTNGGPVYHVVLVKGYKNPNKIITHDVGTRNGADYIYTWDVLESAMHDFAIPMDSGKKRMLEVLPPQIP